MLTSPVGDNFQSYKRMSGTVEDKEEAVRSAPFSISQSVPPSWIQAGFYLLHLSSEGFTPES